MIHQVREEAGDQAPDTAEEEPGAGARGRILKIGGRRSGSVYSTGGVRSIF
jgi:hypothetical protein